MKWSQPNFVAYSGVDPEWGYTIDPTIYPINLTQFDSSLGTLNSVTLSLTQEVASSAYCTASNPTAYFKYYLADQAKWVVDSTTLGNFSFNLTNYPNATVITDKNLYTATKSQTDYSSNQFTSSLTPFIGNGTFATELYEATAVSLGFGNGSSGTSFHYTGEAVVTYDYTPVPVPPSVLLLGSGILGLVGLGWRRRRAI